MNFESGLFVKTRLVSNILMLILLAGNIWFSVQYTSNIKEQADAQEQEQAISQKRFQIAKFLKLFIDKVLDTQGTVSFDDRVALEDGIRQLGDPALTDQWAAFVASKDTKSAQDSAIKLMSMLSNKMIN
jgi:hypothetical protein